MDAGERDQGDEVSGMSDSGTPKRRPAAAAASHGDEAAGPSGRAGGGGSGGGDTGGGEDGGAGDGGAAGGLDPTNEERVRRRREINRNSQKRIRERRNKEMDELRLEAQRLSSENEALLKQVEALTLARADMLRQVQDLTDKWQQSIAENAWLNRENIQLRNAVQQLNALLGGGGGSGGSGGGGSGGGLNLPSTGGDVHGGLSLAPPAAVMPPRGLHPAGSVPVGRTPSVGSGGPGLAGLSAPPPLAGLPTCLAAPLSGLTGSAGLGALGGTPGSLAERIGRSHGLPDAGQSSALRPLAGLPVLSSLGMLLGQAGGGGGAAQLPGAGDHLGSHDPDLKHPGQDA